MTFLELYAKRQGISLEQAQEEAELIDFENALRSGQFATAFVFLATLSVWLWALWGAWV